VEQQLHAQLLRQQQQLLQQQQALQLLATTRSAPPAASSAPVTPDILARTREFSQLEQSRFPGREPLYERAAMERLAEQEAACYDQLDAEEAVWEAAAHAAARRIEMNRPFAVAAQRAIDQKFADEDERWFQEEYCATHFPEDSEVPSASSSSNSSLPAGTSLPSPPSHRPVPLQRRGVTRPLV
jgi:hypothetical protein